MIQQCWGLFFIYLFPPFNWPVFFHREAYVVVKKKNVILSRDAKT